MACVIFIGSVGREMKNNILDFAVGRQNIKKSGYPIFFFYRGFLFCIGQSAMLKINRPWPKWWRSSRNIWNQADKFGTIYFLFSIAWTVWPFTLITLTKNKNWYGKLFILKRKTDLWTLSLGKAYHKSKADIMRQLWRLLLQNVFSYHNSVFQYKQPGMNLPYNRSFQLLIMNT